MDKKVETGNGVKMLNNQQIREAVAMQFRGNSKREILANIPELHSGSRIASGANAALAIIEPQITARDERIAELESTLEILEDILEKNTHEIEKLRELVKRTEQAEAKNKELLAFLYTCNTHSGRIVSSNDLTELQITEAKDHKYFYVDDDGFGWAFVPWGYMTKRDSDKSVDGQGEVTKIQRIQQLEARVKELEELHRGEWMKEIVEHCKKYADDVKHPIDPSVDYHVPELVRLAFERLCSQLKYESIFPEVVEVAKKHGYAIALHGSLRRDCDLIAVPWAEECCTQEQLAEALREHLHGTFTQNSTHRPEQKPHGRLAWSIQIGGGNYVDLSVMSVSQPGELEQIRALLNEAETVSGEIVWLNYYGDGNWLLQSVDLLREEYHAGNPIPAIRQWIDERKAKAEPEPKPQDPSEELAKLRAKCEQQEKELEELRPIIKAASEAYERGEYVLLKDMIAELKAKQEPKSEQWPKWVRRIVEPIYLMYPSPNEKPTGYNSDGTSSEGNWLTWRQLTVFSDSNDLTILDHEPEPIRVMREAERFRWYIGKDYVWRWDSDEKNGVAFSLRSSIAPIESAAFDECECSYPACIPAEAVRILRERGLNPLAEVV